MATQETADKIINATIELVREKGYKATTTKAIAEKAGVNEVTIFRHFGSKKSILESAVQRFSYVPLLSKAIREKVVWELEEDLYLLSKAYMDYLVSIQDFVLIGFKEAGLFPEVDEEIANIPLELKKVMMDYFQAMEEKGKVDCPDIESAALQFIYMNFGFFLSKARLGSKVSSLSIENYLKNSVHIFSRGITP
ncbi:MULTISPECIES: TetR/AcrR family transcriptional regulator [Bacillaceae]|uniref:TetR/AcrR family transcriptional regulator n=1 Tax=Bacillaceae TaxID=186817 RepID=UPI000E708DF3|nr:TetR/AcrR family transcriptional regulator [Bacillus sp. PK3_68]RJS61366.1 TetR family transcriptional regulator [Bacillus sp. PK3_68]